MRRNIWICLLLVWITVKAGGQTTLFPGDIAIVGIQTDNPDDFSFVFLTSIQKNTVLFFTDCGVRADGSFRNGEGGLKYTAPYDLATGTLVNYIRDSSDFSKANDAVLGSRGFNLSSSGDQIIAFQDSSIHPRFLFAIQTNSTIWQNECTNSNVSCLPPGLTEGFSAICAGKDTGSSNCWHNAALKLMPSGQTKSESLNEICTRTNWKFLNSVFPLPVENLKLVPESNRYIKLLNSGTIYNINDSLFFDITESNLGRIRIWFENLNLKDSFQLQDRWPVFQKRFIWKLPISIICDSFQLLIEDADFPGFLYSSETIIIQDTIPLRLIEIHPDSIKQGDNIKLIFNKAMLPMGQSLVLRNLSDQSDSIILSYASGEIIMNGEEIILLLNAGKAGASYDIEIPEGWMSDIKGNMFSGLHKDEFPVFNILKTKIIDSLAPELLRLEPALDYPIGLDQKIHFIFNEPLYSPEGDITDPDVLGDIISIQDLSGDNYYDFIIEFDSLFTSFTILPLGLEEGKTYFISIYGLADSTGNECDEFIYTFETTVNSASGRSVKQMKSVHLYPNPAQNFLQIAGKDLMNSRIQIFDILGRSGIVQTKELSDEKIIFDISSLETGVYFIIIKNKEGLYQMRFIKN
jgi:hypothetical protein